MYQYQPLPPITTTGRTPPFTRLLYLEPGKSDNEPFCGRLEVVNVEDAPPYEALSYTWGIGDPTNYIWFQGNPLPIKPNLESALRSLRLPNQVRCLWIDALCIDQSSVDERSRQVRYMRLVYKHCARVVAWLGPKSGGAEEAFEAAKRLADVGKLIAESDSATPGGRPAQIDNEFVTSLIESAMTGLPLTSMGHLVNLFDREYFRRTWVVQEVAVSPWTIAKCEGLEMCFFDLISTLLFLGDQRRRANLATSLNVWYSIFGSRQQNQKYMTPTDVAGSLGPLLDLLEDMRSFKATDVRDKVYSILGICDEGIQPVLTLTRLTRKTDRYLGAFHRAVTNVQNLINSHNPQLDFGIPAALKPDYGKDTASVYTDLVRFMISKSPMRLDVLSHVQHHSDPSPGEYPTWVPKWFEAKAYQVFREGGGCFNAGLCTPPLSDILQSRIGRAFAIPRALTLEGFHVGVVQIVSDVITFERSEDSVTAAIERVWSQLIPMPMVPKPRKVYRTGEPLDVAFCKAVSAHPCGIIYGSLFADAAMGFRLPVQNFNMQTATQLSERGVASFLDRLGRRHGVSQPSQVPLQDGTSRDAKCFRSGFCTYSYHRRAFLTRDGHIGIGPMIMRPGDEVVVLFRGTMPYVLRRRQDHHIFVGDCYVRDDDIMYGKVTESVRHGRSSRPIYLYEIR
ncbi:hypothetical protein DL768_011752 [Monosporascus sp. mg162]|nr:hypothetical protein DL768_011752 [Monosporascus sp. mg162]